MLSRYSKILQTLILSSLVLALGVGLSACDSNPPELMKAVKQFESDEIRDAHVKNMRVNHMDELLHKRDETMIKGIRTKKHSLKACINCHVPEQHNGKALKHTDPEHFCSTCHGYVAQQLDCFQCHADRPNNGKKVSKVAPDDSVHKSVKVKSLVAAPEKYLPSSVASISQELKSKLTSQINTDLQKASNQSVGE
jgi:hypothetical protein